MSYQYQAPFPPPGPSSPPRPDKATLQREYRGKEGECFDTLRDVIRERTGIEPRTRYEILTKAIEMLRGQTQVGTPTRPEHHQPALSPDHYYSMAPPMQEYPHYSGWQAGSTDQHGVYNNGPPYNEQYYISHPNSFHQG